MPDWIDLSIFLSVLCPIAVIDIREKIVPDEIVFTGLIVFFMKNLTYHDVAVPVFLIRGAAGFLFVFVLFFFLKAGSVSVMPSCVR